MFLNKYSNLLGSLYYASLIIFMPSTRFWITLKSRGVLHACWLNNVFQIICIWCVKRDRKPRQQILELWHSPENFDMTNSLKFEFGFLDHFGLLFLMRCVESPIGNFDESNCEFIVFCLRRKTFIERMLTKFLSKFPAYSLLMELSYLAVKGATSLWALKSNHSICFRHQSIFFQKGLVHSRLMPLFICFVFSDLSSNSFIQFCQ